MDGECVAEGVQGNGLGCVCLRLSLRLYVSLCVSEDVSVSPGRGARPYGVSRPLPKRWG